MEGFRLVSTVLTVLALLLALAVSAACVLVLRWGVRNLRLLFRLREAEAWAEGRVVTAPTGLRRDDAEEGARRWSETITFTLADGTTVTGAPAWSDLQLADRTGEQVPVAYDPSDPRRFVSPEDGQPVNPLIPTLTVAASAGVLLLAVAGGVVPAILRLLS